MAESRIRLEAVREKFIVYRAGAPSEISEGLIDGLEWPATAGSLLFSFDRTEQDACERLTASLGEKYLGRFLYYADVPDLPLLPAGAEMAISEYVFRNHKELQELYLRTEKECFGKKWGSYFPGRSYLDAIEHNARERLSEARIFCVAEKGVPVALLPLTTIKHFLDGGDMDWVLWVWVEESLGPQSRRTVHAKMSEWLKRNVGRRVMTGVHVFNLRSNRFFIKLGFRRQWLQITRRER